MNLTDGLDGLAIGPSMITAAVMGIFAYSIGNTVISEYLELKYIAGTGTLAIFCAALMGGGLGFLWFNTYPASLFMGDTGALALGGALGTIAVMVRQEIVLVIAGGIFIIEMFSLIVQVISFQSTGRRIFRMGDAAAAFGCPRRRLRPRLLSHGGTRSRHLADRERRHPVF